MMLLFVLIALTASVTNAYLLPRDSGQVCSGLSVQSNNGDRKMAIVIDSSSSMLGTDPTDLRLDAGKSILDWLVSKNNTSGNKKEDVVAVIDFSDEAKLDYGLGDPAGAYSPMAGIVASGGTYIASGVKMAMEQLTAGGTGDTKDRSGIVVFTDGSVSFVAETIKIKADSHLG
jgi:Mg-chelatase subunit ChlD